MGRITFVAVVERPMGISRIHAMPPYERRAPERADVVIGPRVATGLAKVGSFDESDESASDETDDLNAGGCILRACPRFRSVSGKPGGGSSPLIRIFARCWNRGVTLQRV
jgi:hypothetical protein